MKLGISQGELSRRTGLPREHLSRIENGHADPKWSTVLKMARGLGVSVGRFDDGAGGKR